MNDDIWWRMETKEQTHWDEWGEYVTGRSVYVTWRKFKVLKYTPKGVRLREINTIFSEEHFVLGTAVRQIAQPTRALAAADEVARRKRHVQGAEARLAAAKKLLTYAEMHQSQEER